MFMNREPRQGARVRRGLIAAGAIVVAALTFVSSPAHAETPIGGAQLTGKGKIVNLSEGADPLPDVWAATWLVANADTGEVLAAKGPHIQRAPASTLKTLTSLAVMPQLDSQQIVRAKKRAVSTYGSKVGLVRGKQYTIEDLYYALLLPSANDAAIALAQANGGVKSTVDQMNTIAQAIGAQDTVAKTPNGLDAPGQVSSAYDLALIAREAMKIENFREIVKTKKYAFPYKKKTREIYNTNRLLTDGYKGTIGIKTGFTTQAGRTFIGAAERKGTTLIVVAMGIKEASSTAASKLLDWAFANGDKITPIGNLIDAPPGSSNVGSASTTSGTALVSSETAVDSDAPTNQTTAGPSGESLDPLAMGWIFLFIAVAAFVAYVFRSAFNARRNRGQNATRGRIKLEG